MFVNGYTIAAKAYLRGANLSEADLSVANLSVANLRGAYLREANLSGANLRGAIWKSGRAIKKVPLQISGLRWPVMILDEHMQIGCQVHPLKNWEEFSDAHIRAMDGSDALTFWRQYKTMLLSLAKTGQIYYED